MKNWKDKALEYRAKTNYKLPKNSYVLCMIDGRSFSKLIKNNYEKPFSDEFISIMNQVAQYVCAQIQGCKFAYVQSDEITFFITDVDTPNSTPFFDYRLNKMQPLIASMATAKFNQLVTLNLLQHDKDAFQAISKAKLPTFDCKCWTVPTPQDVIAWFNFRHIDCIRNSKLQAAQSYLPHKLLCGKNTDEQIQMLHENANVDWHAYDDGKKNGRFIFRQEVSCYNKTYNTNFQRHAWLVTNATHPLDNEALFKLIPQKTVEKFGFVKKILYFCTKQFKRLKHANN